MLGVWETAGLFFVAFARSLASPIPVPTGPIPSPLCAVTAAISAGTCDAAQMRSLFDILWSCLGVIFLCTYISVHHNIPDQRDSLMKKTWLKIRTMLYALLAPEVVIMWALRQRITAGEIGLKTQDNIGWTRTHGFFVQMGGLMVQVPCEVCQECKRFEVVICRLSPSGLSLYTKGGTPIQFIPGIREREILDRGKGDFLSKSIVILQTSWFIAQCITRRMEGLVITELELVTLAFAVLNAITYALWWEKPLNVEYPIYFDLEGKRVDGPEDPVGTSWYVWLWDVVTGTTQKASDKSHEKTRAGSTFGEDLEDKGLLLTLWIYAVQKPFVFIFEPLLRMTNEEDEQNGPRSSVPPFYAAPLNESQHANAYLLASIIGVVFGAVHIIGWDFAFLTNMELLLWRLSSVILVLIPLIITISRPFDVKWWAAPSKEAALHSRIFWILAIHIGSPLYIAARIAILVLACFQLRNLSDSALESIRWSDYIPHF